MSTEFRVYNKLNCSFFDLLGRKEPDQTKGLGFLLSSSPEAMEKFLQLLFSRSEVTRLLNLDCIVNCELTSTSTSQRTDIFLRFFNNHQPDTAIVIEAKDAGKDSQREQVTLTEKWKCGNVEMLNFVTSAVNTGEVRDSSIKRDLGCVVTPKVS